MKKQKLARAFVKVRGSKDSFTANPKAATKPRLFIVPDPKQ